MQGSDSQHSEMLIFYGTQTHHLQVKDETPNLSFDKCVTLTLEHLIKRPWARPVYRTLHSGPSISQLFKTPQKSVSMSTGHGHSPNEGERINNINLSFVYISHQLFIQLLLETTVITCFR